MLLLRYFLFLTPVVNSIFIGYMTKRKGKSPSEIERLKSEIFANGTIAPFYGRLYWMGDNTCGSSLLSEQWAVTAAHCVTNAFKETFPVSQLEVIAGKFDYRTGASNSTCQKRKVEMIYVHPLFHKITDKGSDVALLKFAEPFEFNDNVKKIDIDDNIPSTGESVTVAGFGTTYQSSGRDTMRLRYITQPIPDRRYLTSKLIDETVFCHGTRAKMVNDTGKGDSGGPVWVVREDGPKLSGVLSFHPDRGTWRNKWTCSVALAKMKSWIKDTMEMNDIILKVTEYKQVYSWSNKGRNYQNGFIMFDCGNKPDCTISVKYFEWDFGRSKESCRDSYIEIYNHDTSAGKSGIITLSPYLGRRDYYPGWTLKHSKEFPIKIKIYGAFMNENVKIKFTYRLYDEKQQIYEDETCGGHKSFKCDEVMDCMDMRDEKNCKYNDTEPEKQNKYTVGCYPDDYKCPGENKCIRKSQICDFALDCLDGNDEHLFFDRNSDYCNYTDVFYSHARGMGSIITAISVVSLFHMCVYL